MNVRIRPYLARLYVEMTLVRAHVLDVSGGDLGGAGSEQSNSKRKRASRKQSSHSGPLDREIERPTLARYARMRCSRGALACDNPSLTSNRVIDNYCAVTSGRRDQ